jgi:predicted choloylglycine hydrolase
MVDISYLGFFKTAPITDQNRSQLLSAPYLPFDGMNEKGLAVGMMAISDIQPVTDPDKITIDSLAVIRLLLDKAANVEEALALLEKYNVDFSGGPVIHYLIADISGHSAVVEYGDAQKAQPARFAFPNDQPWQVATNFVFAPQPPAGADSSCWRYNLAYQTLAATEGKLTQPEAMALLRNVSQPNTLWSVTYNLRSGQVEVSLRRHYDQVHQFQLDMAK